MPLAVPGIVRFAARLPCRRFSARGRSLRPAPPNPPHRRAAPIAALSRWAAPATRCAPRRRAEAELRLAAGFAAPATSADRGDHCAAGPRRDRAETRREPTVNARRRSWCGRPSAHNSDAAFRASLSIGDYTAMWTPGAGDSPRFIRLTAACRAARQSVGSRGEFCGADRGRWSRQSAQAQRCFGHPRDAGSDGYL